jgi:hypothetical protein
MENFHSEVVDGSVTTVDKMAVDSIKKYQEQHTPHNGGGTGVVKLVMKIMGEAGISPSNLVTGEVELAVDNLRKYSKQ